MCNQHEIKIGLPTILRTDSAALETLGSTQFTFIRSKLKLKVNITCKFKLKLKSQIPPFMYYSHRHYISSAADKNNASLPHVHMHPSACKVLTNYCSNAQEVLKKIIDFISRYVVLIYLLFN